MKKTLKIEVKLREKFLNKALRVVSKFYIDISCTREMFNVVVLQLDDVDKKKKVEIDKMMKGINNKNTKGITYEKIKILFRSLAELNNANSSFRKSQIILIISLFDRFIYDVLEIRYLKNPELLLNNNEKNISLKELFRYRSRKAMIAGIMRKEISNMIKEKSRKDLLELIEKAENLKFLEKNTELVKEFLEICERRNLFAHHGDEVNEEYIRNCRRINNSFCKNLKIGKRISVSPEYFNKSCDNILKLAIKLFFCILVHEFNTKNEKASVENFFNEEIGYEFLKDKKWDIAKDLFKFFLSNNKEKTLDSDIRKIFLINYCICLERLGNKKEMKKILDDMESASLKKTEEMYKLACLVLKSKFDDAATFMLKMNKRDLDENSLSNWVLFDKFRLTPQFLVVFKKLFKKSFKLKNTTKNVACKYPNFATSPCIAKPRKKM